MYRDEVHVRHILLKPSEIRSPEATQQLAPVSMSAYATVKTLPSWPNNSVRIPAQLSMVAT